MEQPVPFRPHHFLCALCFQGNGYSPKFVQNFKQILAKLNSQQPITVVAHTDAICNACPKKQSEKKCRTEKEVQLLDKLHAEALQIKEGDQMTWNQAKKIISERIDLKTFHRICQTCSWKESGICESVIREIKT